MSVLTLADAKNYMNITSTATDGEIQLFIDAAEASIVNKCGPLVSTTITTRRRGGKCMLVLPVTPVLTLTSVTPVGSTALDVTKLYADPSGTIEYLTGGEFSARLYDVVYTAGRTTTPADLLQGVREHTRHLWDAQLGGTRRSGAGTSNGPGAAAYVFTWRVNELIAPYIQDGLA